MGDGIGDEVWRNVKRELRGNAKDWWDQYRDHLLDLTVDELKEIGGELAAGHPISAKIAVVRNMTDDEWKAYRDGTTERLHEIAKRRFEIADALSDLTKRVAKILGAAIGAVLGV